MAGAGRVRDIGQLLKPADAAVNLENATEKAKAVIAELCGMHRGQTAGLLAALGRKTLTRYGDPDSDPDSDLPKQRTHSPIERIMHDIRRRPGAAGAFQDRQSCL